MPWAWPYVNAFRTHSVVFRCLGRLLDGNHVELRGGDGAISGDNVSDRVMGTGFSYDCRIGFHEAEYEMRQRLVVDFEAETDWRQHAIDDDPRGVVDYFEVNKQIGALVEHKDYLLIEAVAEDIARLICANFAVTSVRVRVTKRPHDMPNAKSVAVECVRTPDQFDA